MKRSGFHRSSELKRSPMKPRASRMKQGGRIAPKKRSPLEFIRIYHSRVRVQWVKRQPCIAAGRECSGEIENAHTENGGTGRKAGYETIVPACKHHHDEMHDGVQSFEAKYGLDLEACAAATEYRWLAYKEQGAA